MAGPNITPEQRFWSKVVKSETCWIWAANRTSDGYGSFSLRGRQVGAHRVAFVFASGAEIPKGLCVCHRCDNPACVNPEHLFLGSHAENMRDASRKNRMHPGERNPISKLNSEIVREMRRRWVGGETARSLAAEFGVHHSVVQSAVSGKSWAHVGGVIGRSPSTALAVRSAAAKEGMARFHGRRVLAPHSQEFQGLGSVGD